MNFTSDDPIASTVSWDPLKKGGANFKTHNLIETAPGRLEYKGVIFYRLMPYLFIGVGLVFGGMIFNSGSYIGGLAFGLIFIGLGSFLGREANKPIVFDKTDGYFWKGKVSPRDVINLDDIKTYAALEDIYALQVITEHIKGDKSSYNSYEINLVLKDASRLNVVDYGNKRSIEKDLEVLEQFLGVPVWRY